MYKVPLRDVLRGVPQERIENIQHAICIIRILYHITTLRNIGVVVPVAACVYNAAAETHRPTDRMVRQQKQLGSNSNTARTNYGTRMVLLPALLAGGRRV